MNFSNKIFSRKIKLSRKDIVCIAVTAVYALITFMLVAHHEPFEDEVNVWMILHNLDGLTMWKHIIDSGNPPGFFLLLLPFVKAGLSYVFVQSVCWFSCVLAVFFLNRFSPFPAFLNIVITFSAPMLYVYPVIARCYSLLPLLIFLAAWFYPCSNDGKKTDTVKAVIYLLLLAAIAQNHVILFAFAGGLALLYSYKYFYLERKRSTPVIVAGSAVFIALAAIIVQCITAFKTNTNYLEHKIITFKAIKEVLMLFFGSFYDIAGGSSLLSGNMEKNTVFYILLCSSVILCIILLFCLYRGCRKAAVLMLVSSIFPLYIYVTRHSVIMPYRVFIVHLFYIFFFWILINKEKGHVCRLFTVSALFLFLITIPSGIKLAVSDFNGRFSAARDIADFIKRNIPDDGTGVLISPSPWQGTAVAFYLAPVPVYMLNGNEIKCIDDRPGALDNRLAESGITKGKRYIYIIASKYQREYLASRGYTFIYETPPAMITEEDYVLYRIP